MGRQKIRVLALITAFTFCSSIAANAVTIKGSQVSDQDIRQAFEKSFSEQSKASELDRQNKTFEKLGMKPQKELVETKVDEKEKIRAIVQLDNAPAIKSGASEESVKAAQANLIAKVEAITGNKIRKNFGYLVNGFSIETTRGNLQKISDLSGVKNVQESKVYYPDMNYATQITKAIDVWKNNNYKGEGLVVSIIDTGIDYRHKDLKNIKTDNIKLHKDDVNKVSGEIKKGKYFTDKVPFGYNYADGNDEVIDKGDQHGMHVAGIVAANGDDDKISSSEAIKGVAPEAQLLAMKVFSNNEDIHGAYDDDIINAIEDSVKLGANIINMSLGSSAGFIDSNNPQQVAVKNATDKGVICVISAGNAQTSTTSDGWSQPLNLLNEKDTGMVGSPGTSEDALTVASMENTNMRFNKIKYTTHEGNSKEVYCGKGLNTSLDVFKNENEVVDCGIGNDEGFKGKDLKGKVALMQRGGGILLGVKSKAAEDRGAIGVILYNSEVGGDNPLAGSFGTDKTPGFSVGLKDGKEIANLIKAGKNKFKFELVGNGTECVDNTDKYDMSQFSSWGLTPSLDLKPEITAPGGDIYSLANNDSYQYMSGTSMSSPHMAGGEALIIQSIKSRGLKLENRDLVTFAKNTAINTAVPMKDKNNSSVPYSPRRQGAGLLQLDKAVVNNVILTNSDGKATVSLKEIGENTNFTLKLKNYGNSDVSYKLDKEAILSETTNKALVKGITVDGASLGFSSSEVTVKAGGEATVNVTLKIPYSFAKENFVEGFVKFNSKDDKNPNLSIPFVGFYGDWSKEPIIDAPAYDTQNSRLHQTLLITTYPGMVIPFDNPDKAAISPNGDNYFDKAIPAAYFLRNAKSLDAEIVDANGKVIRDLYKEENVTKNALEDYMKGTKFNKILKQAAWDGTIYNSSTGQYEAAKDGQYLYRLKTKIDLPNAKEQVVTLPIKVDTVAPKVTIKSLAKDSNNKYILKWTASDELSGINSNVVFINGQSIGGAKPVLGSDGVYTKEVTNVNDNGANIVQVATLDNAFNIGKDIQPVTVGTIENVYINNLKDGAIINKNALIDNKLSIFGGVSDNVDKLSINNKNVDLIGRYFEYDYEPKEGENTLVVKAIDKDNKELYNKSYKFTYDSVNPELTITEPKLIEKEFNYVQDKNLTFKGTVKDDNLSGIKIINLQGQELGKATINADGTFVAPITIINDLENVNIIATDKAGNSTRKNYIVSTKPKAEAPFAVNFSNLSTMNILSGESAPNDIYTIKGSVTKKVSEFKIAGKDVTVNDDLSFSTDIKLVQGMNKVSIYAKAVTGEVFESSSRIQFDSKMPNIKINGVTIRKDGNIYANTDTITLKGEAGDNLYGFTLKINGDVIFNYNRYPSQDPNVVKKAFEKVIELKQEQTKVEIEVTDFFGNTVVEDLNVILDKVAPNKPSINLNPGALSNKVVTATINSDEAKLDSIEYSFDGTNYSKYTEPLKLGASTTIYARAIDYAGNVSEKAESKVEVDTTAPNVEVKGVEEGGIYTTKVTPVVTTDDKDATVEMKLNGQAYKGEAIDTANKYKLEITAKDKAGNVTNKEINFEVKKTIVVKTNGENAEVSLDEVKSNDSNVVVDAKDATNSKVTINPQSLNDNNKNIVLNSKNVGVVLPTSIINDKNIKSATLETKEVTDLKDANKGFKFLGKIYDFNLNAEMNDGSKKAIKTFGNTPVKLSFKLTPEEAKSLDVSKLAPFYYDEEKKDWVPLNNGSFDKDTLTYTFEVVHFSRYTIGIKDTPSNVVNVNDVPSNGSSSGGNSANTSNSGSIVKTGSPVATTAIVIAGLGLMVVGAFAIVYGRRKKVK